MNRQKRAASLAAGGKHTLFDKGAVTANPSSFLLVSALFVRLAARSLRPQPRCCLQADPNSVPPVRWVNRLPDIQSFLCFLSLTVQACRELLCQMIHYELRRPAFDELTLA